MLTKTPALEMGGVRTVMRLPRKITNRVWSVLTQLYPRACPGFSPMPRLAPNIHVQIIARFQVADAQLGQIACIALVNLF